MHQRTDSASERPDDVPWTTPDDLVPPPVTNRPAGAERRSPALPYSCGRRSARRIARATSGLRSRLGADRPRVPARERRRRARVVLVHADGVSHARAALSALVDDGATHYTVALELERRDGRWTVTDVGG